MDRWGLGAAGGGKFSADFSEMLRSGMREDEWLLLLHGAVLGFGAGCLHLLIFG